MIKLLSLALLLFTFSCSTLKDEDCTERNWKEQGFRDASKGYSDSMYETYLKVCEQEKSASTLALYMEGYDIGAKKYCTLNKGILVGEAGRPYPEVCPKEQFPEFNKGFLKGKKKTLK